MKITICGGGSLGHVCIGVLSSQEGIEVSVLTNKPLLWNKNIIVTDCNLKNYEGTLDVISNNPKDVIPNADIVFFCLPGFAIKEELKRIKPFLTANSIIGTIVSSTGFFFFAHDILGYEAKLFGFQRVPFIARTAEYGKSAKLLGYKESVKIAVENIKAKEQFRQKIERIFLTSTSLLSSYYEASLTNSNPILHTGRLYTMWKDWHGEVYDRMIMFYKDWTVEASKVLIEMDAEFMKLLAKLPVDKTAIPSLLEYYESYDAQSLCDKIKSIPAFKDIISPMKKVDSGWLPDFTSRYFTEDFPYGLAIIKRLCDEKHIDAPTINKVFAWGMSKCKKQ